MNAKCCDRCGKFYRAKAPEGEELILAEPRGEDVVGVDLCPACYQQLYRWLKREKSKPKHPAVEVPELNGGFIFK